MDILHEGKGELIGWHDPNDARDWVVHNKSRELISKVMTPSEAIDRFVRDGYYIASGGFGHVRVSMAIVYEALAYIFARIVTTRLNWFKY